MKNRFHNRVLVTMADEKRLIAAKQLFSSAYHKGLWKGDLVLLAYKIDINKLTWFIEKGILIKRCETIMPNIGNRTGIHLTKFYLFDKYFKKWKNIVYLDTDIMVRATLTDLEKVSGFWAARDIDDQLLHHQLRLNHPSHQRLYESLVLKFKLQLDFDKPSFNAGVLAFSSDIIKTNSFSELIKLAANFDKICNYADQTILNVYFYNKWQKLPRVYNTHPQIYLNMYKVLPKYLKPIILHFAGDRVLFEKPWDKKSVFYSEWKGNLLIADKIKVPNTLKLTYKNLVYKITSIYIIEKYLYLKRLLYYLKILNY